MPAKEIAFNEKSDMKKLLYIKDVDENSIAVPLKVLLNDLEMIGNKYVWSILFLEAWGDLQNITTYPEIEESINSKHGYCLNWSKLKLLASKFDQVIDICLVASEDKSKIQNYKGSQLLYSNYPIVIEMVDGDFWELCVSDEEVVSKIIKKYKMVEVKEISFNGNNVVSKIRNSWRKIFLAIYK